MSQDTFWIRICYLSQILVNIWFILELNHTFR